MDLLAVGVGAGDLHHVARAEAGRILKRAKGDDLAIMKLLIQRLRDLDLVNDSEVATLTSLYKISIEASGGKKSAATAHHEARKVYSGLLATGDASPVALALASSSAGSYAGAESPDGAGNVVFAKSGSNWEGKLGVAGAVIGSVLGGPAGATIGGALGGVLGGIVDDCKD